MKGIVLNIGSPRNKIINPAEDGFNFIILQKGWQLKFIFCKFKVLLCAFTAVVLRLAELTPITTLEFPLAIVGKFGDGL